MNKEKFKSELNSLDWPNVLWINNNNIDLLFDLFFEDVNKLILKHAPLKKKKKKKKKKKGQETTFETLDNHRHININ